MFCVEHKTTLWLISTLSPVDAGKIWREVEYMDLCLPRSVMSQFNLLLNMLVALNQQIVRKWVFCVMFVESKTKSYFSIYKGSYN